jgi:regulator of replication initiation timing
MDLEPVDRLEEKIRLLVAMVTQLREEKARAVEYQATLVGEIEGLRNRLAIAEGSSAEVSALREERDAIRTRVADMLMQLEAI